MFNKKSMNPLISTTLLVAFAAAIGASFVSYAGFYFETKSLNKALECDNYIVDFFGLDKTKTFCTYKFTLPLAVKFGYKNKPVSETNCYISIASGTSQICSAEKLLINKTWIPSEDIKI